MLLRPPAELRDAARRIEAAQASLEVRRFTEDLAQGADAQLAREGHEQAATLVDHFNAVVRRVLDFRWRHLSYIEQYVLKPSGESGAKGTGGTPFMPYLKKHRRTTFEALVPEEGGAQV